MRFDFRDALLICGILMVDASAWLRSVPLGLLVTGVSLALLALLAPDTDGGE